MAEQRNAVDQRQYMLMLDRLRQYEQGATDLGSLVAGLEALLECLEVADEAWRNEFRREWGILEEVYAVALDRVEQGAAPSVDAAIQEPNSQNLIREAIAGIRRLLADRAVPDAPWTPQKGT